MIQDKLKIVMCFEKLKSKHFVKIACIFLSHTNK